MNNALPAAETHNANVAAYKAAVARTGETLRALRPLTSEAWRYSDRSRLPKRLAARLAAAEAAHAASLEAEGKALDALRASFEALRAA